MHYFLSSCGAIYEVCVYLTILICIAWGSECWIHDFVQYLRWNFFCRFWTNIKCLMMLEQEKVLQILGVCPKVWYWLVTPWVVLLLELLLSIPILGNQQFKLFLHFHPHISIAFPLFWFPLFLYCIFMVCLNVWRDTCILFRSPPVAMQPSLGRYFARVNSEWREGYKAKTTNTGRYVSSPALSDVVVVSISGAYNDYQVLLILYYLPLYYLFHQLYKKNSSEELGLRINNYTNTKHSFFLKGVPLFGYFKKGLYRMVSNTIHSIPFHYLPPFLFFSNLGEMRWNQLVT